MITESDIHGIPINVVARIHKPTEIFSQPHSGYLSLLDPKTVQLRIQDEKKIIKYPFSNVFDSSSTIDEIYESVVRPNVTDFCSGVNMCLLLGGDNEESLALTMAGKFKTY